MLDCTYVNMSVTVFQYVSASVGRSVGKYARVHAHMYLCALVRFTSLTQSCNTRHAPTHVHVWSRHATANMPLHHKSRLCDCQRQVPHFTEVGSATFDLMCVVGARCASGRSVRSTPSRRGENLQNQMVIQTPGEI